MRADDLGHRLARRNRLALLDCINYRPMLGDRDLETAEAPNPYLGAQLQIARQEGSHAAQCAGQKAVVGRTRQREMALADADRELLRRLTVAGEPLARPQAAAAMPAQPLGDGGRESGAREGL